MKSTPKQNIERAPLLAARRAGCGALLPLPLFPRAARLVAISVQRNSTGSLLFPDVKPSSESAISDALANPARALSLAAKADGSSDRVLRHFPHTFLNQFDALLIIASVVLDGVVMDTCSRGLRVKARCLISELVAWVNHLRFLRAGCDLMLPLEVPQEVVIRAQRLSRIGWVLRQHYVESEIARSRSPKTRVPNVEHAHDEGNRWKAASTGGKPCRGWASICKAIEATNNRGTRRWLKEENDRSNGPIRTVRHKPEADRGALMAWVEDIEGRADLHESKRKAEQEARGELQDRGGLKGLDHGMHQETRPNAKGKARPAPDGR